MTVAIRFVLGQSLARNLGVTDTADQNACAFGLVAAGLNPAGILLTRQLALQRAAAVVPPPAQNAPPVAGFTHTADGLRVAFSNTSSDADGSIVTHEWSFGDGTSSKDKDPSKEYSKHGEYEVSLAVIDNKGAKSSKSDKIKVEQKPPPNASLTADFTHKADGLNVVFSNTSSYPDGSTVTHEWSFGDGTTSKDKDSSREYGKPGTYEVILKVVDDKGAKSSKSVTITVDKKK